MQLSNIRFLPVATFVVAIVVVATFVASVVVAAAAVVVVDAAAAAAAVAVVVVNVPFDFSRQFFPSEEFETRKIKKSAN